jgi:hypothetical protein
MTLTTQEVMGDWMNNHKDLYYVENVLFIGWRVAIRK